MCGPLVFKVLLIFECHVVGECSRSDIRGVVPQYTDTLVTSVDNIQVVQIDVCRSHIIYKRKLMYNKNINPDMHDLVFVHYF